MSIECIVVDAGSRYGLHPTWTELRGIATFHLFEMDGHEAARLSQKYQHDNGIFVHPVALYSSDTDVDFHVCEHQALTSIFQSNAALLRQNDYKLREFQVTDAGHANARSIDSFFAGRAVHFLKLDAEGAEYEILHGAHEKLLTSILGVRSEVLFAPLFKDAPLFGAIHQVLLDHGFELVNLDYTGAGNKAGRFTLPGRYGKLMSSDAVWMVGNDRLFGARGGELTENVIRLALFLLLNSATDLAVDLLLRAVAQESVSFEDYRADPLFAALHRHVLLLFKSLLSLPMLAEEDITGAYERIFAREFPLMNRFYQDSMFQ
jgi:FkbM family methyltransferase